MTDERAQPTARDKHRDELVKRLGKVLDGEEHGDVIYACAAVIVFTLEDMSEEARADIMPVLGKFFRATAPQLADEAERAQP